MQWQHLFLVNLPCITEYILHRCWLLMSLFCFALLCIVSFHLYMCALMLSVWPVLLLPFSISHPTNSVHMRKTLCSSVQFYGRLSPFLKFCTKKKRWNYPKFAQCKTGWERIAKFFVLFIGFYAVQTSSKKSIFAPLVAKCRHLNHQNMKGDSCSHRLSSDFRLCSLGAFISFFHQFPFNCGTAKTPLHRNIQWTKKPDNKTV